MGDTRSLRRGSRLGNFPDRRAIEARNNNQQPAATVQPPALNLDELTALVKEVRSAEEVTSSDAKKVLELFATQQATTKALIDTVAALQMKLDAAVQRPAPPPVAVQKRVPKPPIAARNTSGGFLLRIWTA